ncbi:hypothetical protein J1P26_05765 [Neobacillus sp. MM2021_6]|uniref:hypothetical protein n=1 Tax=Bacillaceae TaxID=186817 RepID=UPI0014088AC6|nr:MULTISPECIES: hypothetical protein [Bacillaceae]MBO0959234.1 hypothetical protein [Neobacillus sp. MM2021_6]NHC16847.1 hypothetical protein [Bacillus sp. MM2020_4]
MIIRFYILLILLSGIVSGCQKDLPKPETKPKVISIDRSSHSDVNLIPVYNQNSREIPSLFVQHKIKGNQLLVECIVNGISFRESDHSRKKTGKMVVWVDGKRNTEVTSAAFIIKGLSPGEHKVKLEVVKLTNEPYGLAKEFMVNIP